MMRPSFTFCCFIVISSFLLSAGMAQAAAYPWEGDILGEVAHYTVAKNDTLYSVARKFDLGIVEIMAANPGVDTWLPKEGSVLIIPTAYILPTIGHEGIVVDLSGLRLFYFLDKWTVMTFPIGIGMDGWLTPTGATTIVLKRVHPSWTVPEAIRKVKPNLPAYVPAGPDNPLGDYAMNLGWNGFLIHGTNRPFGIGRRSSHGCMRLYPEDIAALFADVPKGTPVTIIDFPYRLAWKNDTLLLQITSSQKQEDEISKHKPMSQDDIPQVYGDVLQIAGPSAKIDWNAVHAAVMQRTGIPVAIATREMAVQKK